MSRFCFSTIWQTMVVTLALSLPPTALAQRGGHSGGFGGGHFAGHWGGSRSFSGSFRGGFIGQSGFRSGFSGHGGFLGFHRRGFLFPGRTFFPRYYGYYGYPSFGLDFSFGYGYWPGYYYWPPAYTYYPAAPPVVASDAGYPADQTAEESSSSAGRSWLIAFKDGTIVSVTDYWLADSTLNYVNRQGVKSALDLSKVDLEYTRQLNQERGLEFQLPRAKSEYQPRRRDGYGRRY